MTAWVNIATTPTPWIEMALVKGTHWYRVRGVCANQSVESFPMGVWATR